ncbi:MAG: bifunctional phosphoribosylaminoimidazolecarboxamide formyltransferase/IMP cyclohydrolase, partial [Planctomycetaceae bacterium]
MDPPLPRRALISVSDKTGLDQFAQGLRELGFEVLSTCGTARYLAERGIAVIDVADDTGFPEILGGRVKTLHPKVHGAILGRPDRPEDAAHLQEHGIVPFQVVVCNLYPFEETVAEPGVTLREAIEQIDIGGPSMIRSAAKNHAHVAVVTSPAQYNGVLRKLQADELDEETRRELALAAFQRTAEYDRAIAGYLAGATAAETTGTAFPSALSLAFRRVSELRYGENPHQPAAFYAETPPPGGSLATAEQLHGKELSYNNLLDLDAALGIVRDFSDPVCVVIKHTNPCGCAAGASAADAFVKAYAGDPVSAFGSILGFNRTLDVATAERLCKPNRFLEAIIAPDFDAAALTLLTSKPKWKKNVRLMKCPGMA